MNTKLEEFKKSIDTYRKVVDLLNSILENTEKNDLEKALKLTGLNDCSDCEVAEDSHDRGYATGSEEGYEAGKEEAEEEAADELTIQHHRLAKHFKMSVDELKKIARTPLKEQPPCH